MVKQKRLSRKQQVNFLMNYYVQGKNYSEVQKDMKISRRQLDRLRKTTQKYVTPELRKSVTAHRNKGIITDKQLRKITGYKNTKYKKYKVQTVLREYDDEGVFISSDTDEEKFKETLLHPKKFYSYEISLAFVGIE